MFESKRTNAYAELNIAGKRLDAVRASEELEMEIDCVRKRGDYSSQRENTVSIKIASQNDAVSIWTYKTTERETEELADQLDELIAVFNNKIDKLIQIKRNYNCEINICLVLYNHQKSLPGISLSQKQIQFLEKIGATMDYDIYL